MKPITQQQTVAFQQKILTWYTKNKRDLPWRDVPYGTSLEQKAYRILVSEVMLQQTQVSRVIPKYEAWLKKFPTINLLAKASKRDVLQLWSGLGYNRRALYLREAGRMIVALSSSSHRGSIVTDSSGRTSDSHFRENDNFCFPRSIEELKKLPGVGDYTARAIACFAFDEQIAVVDTNIRKVIAIELFNGIAPDRKTLQSVADQLLPKNEPARHASRAVRGVAGRWNQALMDYSAVVLKDKKILIPRQSKFIGSRRYYRGQVIKYLIRHKIVAFTKLQTFLNAQGEISLQDILQRMSNEGLIQIDGKSITLPS